jgi:hypothetical protein
VENGFGLAEYCSWAMVSIGHDALDFHLLAP